MKKVVVIFIILILLVIYFLKIKGSELTPLPDKTEYIAQVNGQGIPKETYEKKVAEQIQFFKWEKQDASLTALQKDAMDRLIDETLVNQYAIAHQISVSDSEVNARYLQVVAGYNRRNKILSGLDNEFLAEIKEMYGTEKSEYLLILKVDILKEKVQVSVKMSLVEWLKLQRQSSTINQF